MIFYFSGTGNSLYAAKQIALHTGEELVSISTAENKGDEINEYTLKDNEIIGFVHPIYSWGPPKIVLEFIEKLKLINYRENYVFSLVTCGGSIGNTMKVMKDCLRKKDIKLHSGFSVKMPNNFILMGDVDSKEMESKKLTEAVETLKRINQAIERGVTGEFKVDKGAFPWLLTGIINPMFNKKPIDTTKFHVNDNCTGCGTCERVCNCNNIKVDEQPQWGERCTLCLACVHYCPVRAIQYGKETEKKGRYTNPNVRIDEIIRR
ncbi:4Fe-4S ferredoxin [Paenibacillus anaericanus]|uniref:4Fe-4S ferredoxin n=1 Tax=Paenibacillus anaericanus TaxID=170367 RepID=A0A3S1DR86_9BACL|nr:EFR1 family ferrodoxin [Paenibacillus anaericanus]RUT45485.1 4Fe-4S ferredoxin [Paenibacillus anaericanus]